MCKTHIRIEKKENSRQITVSIVDNVTKQVREAEVISIKDLSTVVCHAILHETLKVSEHI